jgi:hypothetical protein
MPLIRPNALQAQEGLSQCIENQPPALPVREVRRMHDDGEQEPLGVDEDVTLPTSELFATIEAAHPTHERLHRLAINNGGAGGGSRPAWSRANSRSCAWMRAYVPSSRHWRKYQYTVCHGPSSRGRYRHAQPLRRI